MRFAISAWLLTGLACTACGGPSGGTCDWRKLAVEQAAARFDGATCSSGACISEAIQVAPGDGLPAKARTQDAANNLDVAVHDCRVFFAFRTAPNHFASADAELFVVSSEDQSHWRFEGRFHMGTDLREPRLLSFDGRLFLYFAVLGTDPLNFEPQGMMVSEYLGPGDWTEPAFFYGDGFIPWRTKVVAGVPYLVTYSGGEQIYQPGEGGLEVHWLTTEDGMEWTAVVPGQPKVLEGGGSETDFAFLPDGSLVAVSRNEAGDLQTGWGMKICTAPADDLGAWDCVGDPRKYDSPLVFEDGGRIWLIGRRNLTETGDYDLGHADPSYRELSFEEQTSEYEIDYSLSPKRCSLWEILPAKRRVEFVLDLPSKGDTCFSGIVRADDGLYEVYNYTSPVEGEEISWLTGQTRPTLIYRLGLRMDR